MAIVVLARLHLLTLEQVAGRHVEPAGDCFHQLIASDREAIYVADLLAMHATELIPQNRP